MKITDIKIYQYKIPLRKNLKINNTEINTRVGYIVIVNDQEDSTGAGEVSPLPGLHKESSASSLNQLKQVIQFLLHQEIPGNLQKLKGGFTRWLSQYHLYPSVQFGIESAILNLLASHYKKPLYSLLSDRYQENIPVNGLVVSSDPRIYMIIQKMIDQGYTSIKIKVGNLEIDREIKIINTIIKLTDGKALLRLDANRSWEIDRALYFINSINKQNIEYIEEPLKNSTILDRLYSKTKIPLAIDESLFTDHLMSNDLSFLNKKWLRAIILKPSLIGGLDKTVQYINLAEKSNKLAVISDTFHSGIGISFLACFAAAKIIRKTAAGLNTYDWFTNDLLKQRLSLNHGLCNISNVNKKSKKLKMSLLKKIDM
jgi:O-succinylbenzoate synthase